MRERKYLCDLSPQHNLPQVSIPSFLNPNPECNSTTNQKVCKIYVSIFILYTGVYP